MIQLFGVEGKVATAKLMLFYSAEENPVPSQLYTVIFAWHTPHPEYGSIMEVSCVKGSVSDSLLFVLHNKEMFDEICSIKGRAPTINEIGGILVTHGYTKVEGGLEVLVQTVSSRVREEAESPALPKQTYPPLEVVRELSTHGTNPIEKPS